MGLIKFSANLGFLWSELTLTGAIYAAKEAGFDAVECHWPYETDPKDISKALLETNFIMIGINTRRGDVDAGENGLSALPGREKDAKKAIDEAISYARVIKAKNIHVMAGFSYGDKARDVFIRNLKYACDRAIDHDITILIEPLNEYDAPGYFLKTTSQALNIIKDINRANLKLMFDCYHVQLTEGNISLKLKNLMPYIGHIQFASVPGRGEPNDGELSYKFIFKLIKQLGYHGPIGAEYKPKGNTNLSLGWLKK